MYHHKLYKSASDLRQNYVIMTLHMYCTLVKPRDMPYLCSPAQQPRPLHVCGPWPRPQQHCWGRDYSRQCGDIGWSHGPGSQTPTWKVYVCAHKHLEGLRHAYMLQGMCTARIRTTWGRDYPAVRTSAPSLLSSCRY